MLVLGIETSCDETAVAIVNEKKEIKANLVLSQIDIHKEFGGVVPEIAARNHLMVLDKLVEKALDDLDITLYDIDAIAATSGPGLIGGVMIGMMTAKALASAYKKPFLAINHLEGHALTVRLTDNMEYPYLLLLVSGGHCQILEVKELGQYKKFGGTIDDAVGEAFDKVAQMLGLDYPGGPKIEQLAKEGYEEKFKFPKPLLDSKDSKDSMNFSFSGLKTAVRREIEKLTGESLTFQHSHTKLDKQDICDICASFQKTVTDILINRVKNAIYYYEIDTSVKKQIVIAGGVSANKYIAKKLSAALKHMDYKVYAPPLSLSTDNAVMIAWAGMERFIDGYRSELDFKPRARWELEELTEEKNSNA